MSFKIADAYVAVTPDDTANLGTTLRAKIQEAITEATDGLEATIGLGLTADAPEELRGDLDSAILLSEEDLEVRVSMGLTGDAVEELDADVKTGIDLVEADAKIKVQVDPESAKEAGEGGASLIMAAIGAGLAIGPASLATAMGAATIAIAADVEKSNVAIAADYKQLGVDGANAIKTATAPLGADLNQALVSLDGSLKTLQPDLDSLFATAGPDIGDFTTGVEGLVSNALPKMASALSASQSDVVGFTSALPALGAGVGDFFTGLTKDSTTTGLGIQSAMGTLGSTMGTLGSIMGSASSAISADLLAIDPVLNTFSDAVRAIADPATVGGLAGAFGAFKLDPSISSGLGNLSTRMLDLSERTADSSGIVDKFSGAALKSAGALNTAADVMSGPWGIAIGAGIGLVSGLASELIQASHASDALSLSQQGLADAISKDGGAAGQATAAYVVQSDAANGLTTSAAKAGVSVETWTQAVLGNTKAQADVTAAVGKLNVVQLGQMVTTESSANVTSHAMGDLQGGTATVLAHSQAVGTLTDSNQQLIASMNVQAAQVAGDITKQAQLTAATNALNSSTAIFNATMAAGYQAMVESATQAGDSAVAAVNLGTSQSGLNQQLAAGVTTYQEATSSASSYQTILNSLNGTTMSMDQAQNTLAQDNLNAAASFKTNQYSMDLSTQAGINNRTALTNAAAAITALGVQTYQTTGSMNTANGVIQQQINAFVKATGATGQAKTAIDQYLQSITKIPPNVATTVNANTSQASSALSNLLAQLKQIDKSSGIVTITSPGSKTLSHYAGGGDPKAGETAVVGELGPEIITFGTNAHVTPNSQTGIVAGVGGSGGTTNWNVNITIPMQGFADFTNPHAMTVEARRQAININNALKQLQNSRAGAN